MCVDREKIIDVVFAGYADTVETIVGHISPLENPDLGPLEYDCAAGNQMLDQLGYTKGANGIRMAPATTGANAQPAHPMQYNIMTPTSTDFNVNRAFDIVQEGFKEAGVEVTQQVGGDSTAAYAIETGDNCDADKLTGYDKFDIAMWDWVGYIDPDFMLSVVTKGQWCSWSDTGWDQRRIRQALRPAGPDRRPGEAEGDRLRDAADGLRQLPLHPAHQRRRRSTRTAKNWAGFPRRWAPTRRRTTPRRIRSASALGETTGRGGLRPAPEPSVEDRARRQLRSEAPRIRGRDDLRRDHAQLRPFPCRAGRRGAVPAVPSVHDPVQGSASRGARPRPVQVGAVQALPDRTRARRPRPIASLPGLRLE